MVFFYDTGACVPYNLNHVELKRGRGAMPGLDAVEVSARGALHFDDPTELLEWAEWLGGVSETKWQDDLHFGTVAELVGMIFLLGGHPVRGHPARVEIDVFGSFRKAYDSRRRRRRPPRRPPRRPRCRPCRRQRAAPPSAYRRLPNTPGLSGGKREEGPARHKRDSTSRTTHTRSNDSGRC